ncbi:MAG: DUF1828 domain-containing protein [Salinivirgaceae bacterium]|nr:DUF1828 domain-containing protein [Salinivirgaceae bacterium]
MNEWFENSINQYYHWLKEKTVVKTDNQTGWSVVSTPFLGLFNDPIEVYMKAQGDTILLSDDGTTLKNLDLAGANVTRSPKRKEWLDFILLNYGVELQNDELCISAKQADFPQKKHNLICAISEISDMEITAKHIVSSLFREDVKQLLDEQNIIYTPQFITKGNTGIEFTFDFQIAGREKELVLKSFNSLNKINVPSFLFSLDDIRPVREKTSGKELLSLAVINDSEKEIKPEYINALQSKNTDIIFWSERNKPENIQKLRMVA